MVMGVIVVAIFFPYIWFTCVTATAMNMCFEPAYIDKLIKRKLYTKHFNALSRKSNKNVTSNPLNNRLHILFQYIMHIITNFTCVFLCLSHHIDHISLKKNM